MERRLTKSEVITWIQRRNDSNASFVVNVILTQHRNPARKLQGLLTLLTLGADVRIADRDITRLMVNSFPWTWTELECGDDYIRSLLAQHAAEAAKEAEDSAPARCGCCCVELDENCGKSLGCYNCDKAFCSAGCLESHERTTGHGGEGNSQALTADDQILLKDNGCEPTPRR